MTPWQRLAEPFPFEDIKVMPQSVSRNGDKAKATPYFDARAVMNRLDEVVGPQNWRAEYRTAQIGNTSGVICRLTVVVDGAEIVREDGADPSDIEGFKGALSGALKRAFSALGNRTLYETDLGWQPIESYEGGNGKKQFKAWTREALNDMRRRYEAQVAKANPPAKRVEPPAKPEMSQQEQERNAGLYLARTIGITPKSEQFKQFKGAVGDTWRTVALDAESAGVQTFEELMRYCLDGQQPQAA